MPMLTGVVHGKTIELAEESGLPDGQSVSVIVSPLLPPGEGIRRSAGSWSDDGEELDAWLAKMRRSRHMGRGESGA